MNTSYSTGQCSSVSRRFFGWWCGGRCQDLWQEEQPLYDILQSQLSLPKRKKRMRLYTFSSQLATFILSDESCVRGSLICSQAVLGMMLKVFHTIYIQAVNRFIACVILSLLRENAKATQWLSCWQLRRCSQQIQKDIYVEYHNSLS